MTDRRQLPIASTNVARVVGGVGLLACVPCCVSIPSVMAAISALGLGFLRNDRVLFPAEVVSLVILIITILRSRARHGRNTPLVLGIAAASWAFFGLVAATPLSMDAAVTGPLAVVAIVLWDWRLQRRCGPLDQGNAHQPLAN
jgi:hypothetical protein